MLIINGSPQRNSALRAITSKFSAGAQEAGQEVIQFDAGTQPLPLLSVDADDHYQADDQRSTDLLNEMKKADTIVFATPMFFFDMSAQMKIVIDHMSNWTKALHKEKTGVLITTAPVDNFDNIKSEFKEIFDELGWRFGGQVLAGRVSDPEDLKFYPEVAYELGKSL